MTVQHPDDERHHTDPLEGTPTEATPDEQPSSPSAPVGGANPGPPETGDIVIDAALRDLAAAPADDLDAQLQSGEAVHRTLQSRLSDLGG